MNLKIKFVVIVLIICFCSGSLSNAAGNEQGLVAYYSFDEGEGNVTHDLSGNGNDGTIYGAKWVDGKYEKALEFDGMDDYINCGRGKSLDIVDEITICAWIKPNIFKHADYHIVVESAADYGWFFGTGGGKIVWLIGHNSTSGWNIALIDGILADDWNHIAGTYNSKIGTAEIYLNGIKVGSMSKKAEPTKRPNGFKIGRESANHYAFNGTIDEVKIYNRVLTENEIRSEVPNIPGMTPDTPDTVPGTSMNVTSNTSQDTTPATDSPTDVHQPKLSKELIIIISPLKPKSGEKLQILVKYMDKPVSDAKVTITLPNGGELNEKTNAEGILITRLQAGDSIINVEANKMRASKEITIESDSSFSYFRILIVIIIVLIFFLIFAVWRKND